MMNLEEYPLRDIGASNIEVEGKETIALPRGDLYKVTGRSHKAGGINVLAPPATRIFSQKLKVPKDTYEAMLGKKTTKKHSFADVSKHFNPAPYKQMIENKRGLHDDLTTRTAELMFNKMKSHLDNTFYAQEAFKEGKGMKNEAAQLSQEAQFEKGGSLPKYQVGATVPGNPLYRGTYESTLQDYLVNRGLVDKHRNDLMFFDPSTNNEGVQPKSANPDIYGGVNHYNPDHVAWENYYGTQPGFSSNQFQPLHRQKFQQRFGEDYRYDENSTGPDGKYGNTTARANLWGTQHPGKINERIPLAQYLEAKNSPNGLQALSNKTGLSIDQINQSFSQDNGNYWLDVNKPNRMSADPLAPLDNTLPQVESRPTINPEVTPKEQPVDSPYTDTDYYEGSPKRKVDTRGLLEMLSVFGERADISNPYNTYSPQKAAMQRFNPVNTLANERAYNMQKQNLRTSNVPNSVRQALLAQGQSDFQSGVNEVNLNNFQNDQAVDNANTSSIVQAYNVNNDRRVNANYQYMQELGQRDTQLNQFRKDKKEKLFALHNKRLQNRYTEDLINKFSRNYESDNGDVRYKQGSTADPNSRLNVGEMYGNSSSQVAANNNAANNQLLQILLQAAQGIF